MENQALWISQLFEGVEEVPIYGTPGSIIAYGDKAVPILTDKNQKDHIMAAAQLGKGRVLVFSHGSFMKQFISSDPDPLFIKMNLNIYKWFCNDAVGRTIEFLDNLNSVPNKDPNSVIFVWNGWNEKDETFYSDLLNGVKNGAGLLMGITPWAYPMLTGRSIWFIPMYQILNEIGLCFTGRYYRGANPWSTSNNNATLSHMASELKKDPYELDESGIEFMKYCIDGIPVDVKKSMSTALEDYMYKINPSIKIPSPQDTVEGLEKLQLHIFIVLNELKGPDHCAVAPGVEIFPGKCDPRAATVTAELELNPGRDAYTVIPSGYYLPAGNKMTVTVHDAEKLKEIDQWKIRIGCHSDDLTNKEEWKRWPRICKTVLVQSKSKPKSLSSPFGGLVYFQGPKEGDTIKVQLTNVIKAPFYDIHSEECVAKWTAWKQAPWVDLVGRHIILTVPTNCVGDINPKEALEFWDSVVEAQFDLRGVNIGRQWFVPDVQPSAGYMHAGYPIVTHMDVVDPTNDNFVLNAKALRVDGSWGHFHEIGHNMQSGRREWTFKGTGEVTCNIFNLYVMDVVIGLKPWLHPWLQGNYWRLAEFFKRPDFEVWQGDAHIALFIYAQLARDFGWEAYKKVFRQYEEGPKITLFSERIKQWVITFSTIVGRNLSPLFEFWAFPHLEKCQTSVNHLTPYLPDDEVTQDEKAKARTASILQKWENVDRKGVVIQG